MYSADLMKQIEEKNLMKKRELSSNLDYETSQDANY